MTRNQKICLPTPDGLIFFMSDEINYIKADDVYAYVHDNTTKYFIAASLKTIEGAINGNFFKCHRSYIINLDKVKRLIKGKNHIIVLGNGEEIPVARGSKNAIIDRLKS